MAGLAAVFIVVSLINSIYLLKIRGNPRPVIPYADAICVGEGESWIKSALSLLDRERDIRALGPLPSTIISQDWQPGGRIPEAIAEWPLPENPPFITHPDSPLAAWHIEAARGCPHSCAYCELGHGIPYRVQDIGYLKGVVDTLDPSKAGSVNAYAPDVAGVPRYRELYEYIRAKGFELGFSSMRIDSALRSLPENINPGHLISVGIDGLTERTRFRVNKKITDRMIVDYFRALIERGHVCFKIFMIIGYPRDTMDDFKSWEEMMKEVFSIPLAKNVLLRVKWSPLIPLSLTPLAGAECNYTRRMIQWIELWHDIYRRPIKEPGWFVKMDALISQEEHAKERALAAGGEFLFTGKHKPLHDLLKRNG